MSTQPTSEPDITETSEMGCTQPEKSPAGASQQSTTNASQESQGCSSRISGESTDAQSTPSDMNLDRKVLAKIKRLPEDQLMWWLATLPTNIKLELWEPEDPPRDSVPEAIAPIAPSPSATRVHHTSSPGRPVSPFATPKPEPEALPSSHRSHLNEEQDEGAIQRMGGDQSDNTPESRTSDMIMNRCFAEIIENFTKDQLLRLLPESTRDQLMMSVPRDQVKRIVMRSVPPEAKLELMYLVLYPKPEPAALPSSHRSHLNEELDEGAIQRIGGVQSDNTPGGSRPCRVCNTHNDGFHFGGRTCHGCAKFFKRSVLILRRNCKSYRNCKEPDGERCLSALWAAYEFLAPGLLDTDTDTLTMEELEAEDRNFEADSPQDIRVMPRSQRLDSERSTTTANNDDFLDK